jgi:serine/threonine protein kinase
MGSYSPTSKQEIYLVQRAAADFGKVVDFGISKAVKPGGDEGPETYRHALGFLLGTPLYMSPEQARGSEDLDHRVDHLGAWRRALRVPHGRGAVPRQQLPGDHLAGDDARAHGAVAAASRAGHPDAVEAVVIRAMKKDRTGRYQTTAELDGISSALLAGDQNVGSPPVPAGNPVAAAGPALRRWPLALGAAAVLTVDVAAAISWPGSSEPHWWRLGRPFWGRRRHRARRSRARSTLRDPLRRCRRRTRRTFAPSGTP